MFKLPIGLSRESRYFDNPSAELYYLSTSTITRQLPPAIL
jgi:hypothetical protein